MGFYKNWICTNPGWVTTQKMIKNFQIDGRKEYYWSGRYSTGRSLILWFSTAYILCQVFSIAFSFSIKMNTVFFFQQLCAQLWNKWRGCYQENWKCVWQQDWCKKDTSRDQTSFSYGSWKCKHNFVFLSVCLESIS